MECTVSVSKAVGDQDRLSPGSLVEAIATRCGKCAATSKSSNISIGEDLPKRVQEIKRKILIPAMKKARSLDPRNKAAVIGDKLVVNGRQYLHFNIPKRWLDNQPSADPNEEPIDHDGVMSLNATPNKNQPPRNISEYNTNS